MSVAIVMGSDSDLDIVSKAFGVLDDFGVSYTKNVFSAHRTPDKVLELIKSSEENGVEVDRFIGGLPKQPVVQKLNG